MNIYKKFALLTMLFALVCVIVKAENGQSHKQFAVGAMYANAFGGVTNIKEVVNRTSSEVIIRKVDVPFSAAASIRQEETIPARGVFNGGFWIPWADNGDQFAESHMTVSVNGRVIAWIWQNGEYVRFNNVARFVNNAPVVPGVSRSGGERRMVITEPSRGRFVIRFERFE